MAEKVDVGSAPVREMIRDLIAHHVAVTSTLPVFETLVPGRAPLAKRVLDAMTSEARIAYLNRRASISDAAAQTYWPELFKKEMQFEREFAKAGGLVVGGAQPTRGGGGGVGGLGSGREGGGVFGGVFFAGR